MMSQTLVEGVAVPHADCHEEELVTALERIRDALRGLRFGTVSVIVQDGVVVQVERTERLRLVRRER